MSNNNPILKIGQEVLFVIGLYQKEEKLHKKKTPHAERHISDLGEIRTHDPRFRRPLLYPAELPNQFLNRTYSSIWEKEVGCQLFFEEIYLN